MGFIHYASKREAHRGLGEQIITDDKKLTKDHLERNYKSQLERLQFIAKRTSILGTSMCVSNTYYFLLKGTLWFQRYDIEDPE